MDTEAGDSLRSGNAVGLTLKLISDASVKKFVRSQVSKLV